VSKERDMAISKPTVNTKVRVTVNNTHQRSYSVVWCPETFVVEGTVYYPNPWDNKESIRLLCANHSIKHPVIPLSLIARIEELGKDDKPIPIEVVKEEAPPPKPKVSELVFSIESSKKGSFYKVVKRGSYWTCSCIAGLHGKECKHVKQAQAQEADAEKGTVQA
jgi:hypothetical protein